MLYRRQFLGGALAAPLVFNNALRAMADTASTAKTRTIQVPIDHAAPAGPGFPLDYLVLDDFAPAKPTVFVVGDGQQFYVREDVLPSFRGLFGPDVNIVGIGGRGSSRVLQEGFGNPSDQSWIAAYKALQYSQWLADIDAIRIDLLGKDGKICIYGVSGGGQLAHTYLAAYGANVRYAYTESAVFPTLEAEIGLQHDQFWHEITPNERKRLWDVLSAHPEKREFYAQLLQRQNFFVDLKVLPQERLKLIEAIAKNDNAAIKKASADYQVDTLNKLMSAPEAWSIRVREYEFAWPLLRNLDWKKSEFRPDLEDSELWASPLLALQQRGQIAAPGIDLAPLCDVGAQVTIIAGRYDHTCDYRTQIALASHYRNHLLRLLDDDHQMHRLKSLSGARAALLQAWTKGWDSPAFAQALAMIEPIRWHED